VPAATAGAGRIGLDRGWFPELSTYMTWLRSASPALGSRWWTCRCPRSSLHADAEREDLVETAAALESALGFLQEDLEAVVPLRDGEAYARSVKPRGAAPGRARTP
jgi:hypothetical protein